MKKNVINVEISATQEELAKIELDNFDFQAESWVAWDFGFTEFTGLGPCAKVDTKFNRNGFFIIPEKFLKQKNSNYEKEANKSAPVLQG